MSKDLSDFEKGQIVAFKICGWSHSRIAKQLNRGKSSITGFLKRYKERDDYKRKNGSGRKRLTTDEEDKAIIRIAKKRRTVSAKKIKIDLNLNVTEQTLRNRLHEQDFWSHLQLKKPYVSDVNRQKRLEFSRKHLNWSLSQWKRVIWSDESPFEIRNQTRQRIWRSYNERYKPFALKPTVKHSAKINVWGCFSFDGVGRIYHIKGILNAKAYRQILIRQMLPSAESLHSDGNYIFQQDNDPKHTSKLIQNYLRNKKIQVMEWPPYSPDLNPIENLWSILNDRLIDRNPSNKSELFNQIQEGWNDIPLKILHNLVKSMRDRCQAVIDANGYPTRY